MDNNFPTVSFYTLGCRVNQYETEVMSEAFQKEGFKIGDFSEKCDVYVINTCTVTSQSDRKSKQMIRRAINKSGENSIIMAVGCYTQTRFDDAQKIFGLDYIGGTKDKIFLAKKAKELMQEKKSSSKIPKIEVFDISKETSIEPMHINSSKTTRAFVKIVDGCDNKCSYCIIPKARGAVRSKPISEIIDEVNILSKNGFPEVVLTGIETAAFGKDLEEANLISLLEKVNSCEKIKRIRMGSLEPTVIRGEFVEKISSLEKVMPNFHLSLQSGSNSVLSAMRRRYNTEMFFEGISKLREKIKDITFTTDIIVGFPGETDEMFCDSLEFVRKCGFLYMHIFPYSKRIGTEASEMKNQISESIKKERAAIMNDTMQDVRKHILNSFLGRDFEVLNESEKDGLISGYTPNFIEVRKSGNEKIGNFLKLNLDEIANKNEFVKGL